VVGGAAEPSLAALRFAIGDVRDGSIKRVASAVGEGAAVVGLVHEYVRAASREVAFT
jgi:thioredoxin reductase (NADPH)